MEHAHQIWVLLLVVYLLSGQLESMIRLFTSGRIQINIKREDDDEDGDK